MATGAETVVVLRSTGTPGRHGAPAPVVETEVRRCALIPRTSSEETDGADTVVVGYTLVAPPGTDLLATDRVRARGVMWEIDGEPGDYRNLRGVPRQVIAALRRVRG